jgi:uncharacterized repeat protein (TIGR03803 family)
MLFGTTPSGEGPMGSIFSYDLLYGHISSSYFFPGGNNGYNPQGNLVYNPNDSLLYGVVTSAGYDGDGVLFSYNPLTGQDSTRFYFNGNNGSTPYYGSLTLYNHKLYGMTYYGGADNLGVIYRYDPATNQDTVLSSFTGRIASPYGEYLAPYNNGNMYGMTYSGGNSNLGTLFSYNLATGMDSMQVSLDSATGYQPREGALTLDPVDSMLYGLTEYGGPNYSGTILRFDPHTGKDTAVFNFNGSNGANPEGSLTYDRYDSTFYGMTDGGGLDGYGVVFSYKPSTGVFNKMLDFLGNNGQYPEGNIFIGPDSMLYGVAYQNFSGGSIITHGPPLVIGTSGLLFMLNPHTGYDSIMYYFGNSTGINPEGTPVIIDVASKVKITGSTNATCFGVANGSITAMGHGGFKPYTYTWSSGNTGATATGLLAGTYTVTMKDASGYTTTASATITQPGPIMASISSSSPVSCYGGNNGNAVVSVNGGLAPYTYAWTPSGGINFAAYNLNANNYNVLVTDASGCYTTVGVVITQPSSAISVTLNVTAGNRNQSAIRAIVTGGTPPYSYSWTPAYSLSDSISHLSSGTYSVTVTDSNGCTQNASVALVVVAGINNLSTDDDIKVYPNPAFNLLNVDMDNNREYIAMNIVDITGREIMKENTGINTSHISIDVSTLAAGVYFLRMTGKDASVKDIKFVVER